MPSYKVNDQVFTIPDDKIDLFEADFPEAQLQYKVNDGTSFTIPANKRVDFLADFPDAQEVGWEPLQAPEPQTVASNETIVEQQTVPQEEKLRGFRAGARESWKGLKAGTQFAYGEVANALFGSSDNDANALYKLDEMLREGKDVNAEVEGAWTDAGREIRTGALEFLPGWMIKGWKDRVHEKAEQQKILDDIRDAIGEAGGDIAKAREILAAKAQEKSYGDIQKEKAKEKFADVQETEGFGAWVGENAVQMIPSASALIVGALTKSPGAARAIGMIGMGGMTAATAGSSMYEAREAGASDLETRKVGVVDGALEYITEKLPFDNYTNWMMGKAKSKVTTNLAKALRSGNAPLRSELEELLKAANKELGGKLFSKKNLSEYIADMIAEGASEFTAEASQTMTKLIYDNPDLFPLLGEAVSNGMHGALAGFFMGGVLGGAATTMEHQQHKQRRKEQGHVDVGVVDFGDGQNEIVEILSVDEDTNRATVLHNGAVEYVDKNAIGQSYRYSYEAFEAGRMKVQESEAIDNGNVTEGQIKASTDRMNAATTALTDALRAAGTSEEDILSIIESEQSQIFVSDEVQKAYEEYIDARNRARELTAAYNKQMDTQRGVKRLDIEEAVGEQFWRDIPSENADGVTTWESLVTYATLQDGRRVYLFPSIDATETAGITEDGQKVFVTSDMLVEGSEVTESLNTYLDNLISDEKKAAEQERMSQQTLGRTNEAKAAAQPGSQVNIGTAEEPVVGTIVQTTPDGVIVQSEAGVSQLSWEEYANAMSIGSAALTDEENASLEASEILSAESSYKAQQTTDPAEAENAVIEGAEAQTQAQAANIIPVKADGSVDQTTLWNQDPERWAQWNDEQRQDGGANSLAYITTAIKKESAALAKKEKTYNELSDFAARDQLEQDIKKSRERLARLAALQQKYAPVEEVATDVEALVQTAPTEAVPTEAEARSQRVMNTISSLYNDESLSESEIEDYIAANVAGSQADLDKHIAKAPKMGRDLDKYKADKEAYDAKTAELTAERDFWKEVQDYNTIPEIEMDMEPQNALEFTANELARKDGIKLQRDSFIRHTGYGSEAGNFLSLLRTKKNGGLTLEEAGERLMEMDRENGTGFFDQNDPNAGLNAILDVLGGAKTSGDVSGYIKANREQMAREAVTAARSAMVEDMMQPEAVTEIASELEEDLPEDIFPDVAPLDEDMPDFETRLRTGQSSEDSGRFAEIKERAAAWAKRLGIKVNVLESIDQVEDAIARDAISRGVSAPGWFDPKTGEVYIYAPHNPNLSEVDKTMIHEVISHKGLRGLLGKKAFNALCDSVWNLMDTKTKAKYLTYENVLSKARLAEYKANPDAFVPTAKERRAAADEFIAGYSESVNTDKNAWQKMIDSAKRFINKLTGKYTLGDQLDELIEASLARYEQIAKMELKGVVEEGATYRGVMDAETGAMINPSANEQAEGNTALRAKDGTLVGMHNISEDKLRKAIKQGGLANPSTAVVNIAEYSLEGYGDISLIMPSSLVDSETGDNAGTYTGDAWTPTYPTISRQIDDAGWKIVKDRIRAAVGESDDLYHDIVNSVDNYLSDDRNSRLEFVFLKEKGIEPKIEMKGADGYVGLRNLEAILGVEGLRDSMESYEKYKAASPMAKRSFNMWQRVGGEKKAHKALKDEIRQYPQFAKLMGLDEDLTFAGFDSFTYSIFRKEYDAGNVNTIDTLGGASRYVDANDMRTEFDAWLESLMEEAGAKEVFFAGWTRDGDRIYKDNTLENVSRHMRMQGRTNAYNDHGLSATKSALLQRLTSLAEIRKNRARLQDESSYNRAYDKLKDRLFNIISQLADMEKISDNPFMNIDYAEARLQEAIVKRNPISYLNNEYGYSIDPKGEYAEELKSFIKDVQKMPAKYFETKFERPVYLNEFAAAVMPNNTSEDVKQALTEAGLPIFEYDSAVEGARREATLKATEEEGVRFRILGEMGAANLDAAEEATIRLDNLDIARQMEEAGKDAKTIKLATGWERGVDNLWRYEVSDEYDLANLEKRLQEELDNGATKTWGIVYPSDLGQLLKEYPEFNVDIMVWVGDEFENTGAYSPATEGDENTFGRSASIEVEAKTIADIAPLLAHEIQHAIQEMEGFAEGGQARGLNDKLSAELDKRVATIKQLREEGRNEEADELMQMSKGLAEAVINNDDDAYGNYKKLAGEVEARNAAKRIGKSLQERRESLLPETEDVAREDQIILMESLGVSEMGHKTDVKMSEIGKHYADKTLDATQKTIVDTYSGALDNNKIVIKDKTGVERSIVMRQGNEKNFGTKHSLFRHYGTNTGVINADDIALIPEVLEEGKRTEKANKKVDYVLKIGKVTYTVYTRKDGNGEVFYDFYSSWRIKNKAESSMPTFTSKGGNTQLSARTKDASALSADKGSNNLGESNTRFRVSNENQAIFVSNAARSVEGIKQEKATPEQWLKMLEKAGGLKAGEDKWMGLSDWLKASDKKTLTKQEVLDFINENMIIIEEVHYIEGSDEEFREAAEDTQYALQEIYDDYIAESEEMTDDMYMSTHYDYAIQKLAERLGYEAWNAPFVNMNATIRLDLDSEFAVAELNDIRKRLGMASIREERAINETRLEYTTNGLVNLHEIALTVPTIEPWNKHDEVHFGDAGDGRTVAWIRFGDTQIINESTVGAARRAVDEASERERAILDKRGKAESEEEYRSLYPALEEAIRAREEAVWAWNKAKKESVTKKILVIDEIQSKRHQEGRDRGYQPNLEKEYEKKEAIFLDAQDAYVNYLKETYNISLGTASQSEVESLRVKDAKLQDLWEIMKDAEGDLKDVGRRQAAQLSDLRVPDAPFDKNWHELAMKRMLRYAAENGYDIIAWTKGDQQNQRYDLGGKVETIARNRVGENQIMVHIFLQSGRKIIIIVDNEGKNAQGNEDFVGKDLAEILGKEWANKVLSAEDGTEFSGDDLSVGGEGMRGFYDKMLPAFMNKYGKKWGVKVEDIELNGLENGLTMHSVPVTEEMKASVMEGQVMFRIRGENESAVDFCLAVAKDITSKYRIDAKTRVAEVNEENAKVLGYKDGVINDIAIYLSDYNMIVIFAHEWLDNSLDIECAIFHEINHKYYDNPSLGDWLWEYSDGVAYLADLKREIIEAYSKRGFSEVEQKEELYCETIAEAMSLGSIKVLYEKLPQEYKATVEKVLNETRYDKEREYTERIRRSAEGNSGAESGSSELSGQKQESNGLQSGDEKQTGEDAARNDRVGTGAGIRLRVTEITPEVQDELDAIKASAIVMGNFMKAPNGQPTNLTEEQWLMVRTKSFKNWFGDWENDPENASKVVDENGEPKVVYHGTPWNPLEEPAGKAVFKSGWFTGMKNRARGYGEPVAVFLNIKNPAYSYDKGKENDTILPENFDLNNTSSFGEFDGFISYIDYPEVPRISKIAKRRIMIMNPENYEDVIKQRLAEEPRGRQFFSVIPKEVNQIKSATDNTGEFSEGEGDIRFRIRTKPAPEKTGTGYKVFYLKDGKLYPPMVANQGGVDTPVGVWLDAEEGTRAGESKTGRPKVKQGGKGTQGGSGTLAYRPGWHLGEIPYAIQFNRKDENGDRTLFPADFVWAEVEYANDVDYQDEAMSYGMNANGKFQHSLAGLPKLPTDGSYRYRTNPNPETDPWIITGAMKVNRLLTPSEVDQMVIDAGREPQKRQEGAVTDEQINALNEELGLTTPESNIRFRTSGTPTEQVVAEGVSLSPAQTASLAADIFAALPEDSRKKITDGLNGNILGLQDAILQIPTSLATKENWNDEDRQMAEVVAEQMTKAVGKEMTRPFSASEALWTLYNAVNKSTDLVSEASRALVRRNLGFDSQTLEVEEGARDGVRFRTVGDASDNAKAALYNKGAVNMWTRLKESLVDRHASVEEMVKAIEKKSGKVAQGFENVLMALNQQASKGDAAVKEYELRFLEPMLKEINKIMEAGGFKYEDVVRYVILKHGLERNDKFAKRDAREYYRAEYDKKVAAINANSSLSDAEKQAKIADAENEYNTHLSDIDAGFDLKYQEFRNNDYSGLSSMFYDTLGVSRKDYATEEEYQAALMSAKKDKYSSLMDIETAAENEVADFERAVNTDALWNRINAATKETLRQQYKANTISKDQYDSLRDMFEFYVPLRGFADNTAEDMYTYYRKPNSTGYTKPILAAEGRKTQAESPFGWIAAMAGSAIASNVKNEAKLALYYFVSNRPDNGIATITRTWFMDSGEVDADGKKIFKPAYPPFTEDLSTDAGKAAYEAWQQNMRDLRDKGMAYESGQRLSLGNAVVNISDAHKPEHIVNVKVGGKDYSIIINGNPRAAQAINGDLNIEATDSDYSALFGPMLRWMSSVNTSYNPEFWMTNFQRDIIFTFMAINAKEDPAYRRKFSKNYLKAFKVIKMVYQDKKGTLGDEYLEKMYKEFQEHGSKTGYTKIKSNEEWEEEITKYMKSHDPNRKKIGKFLQGTKDVFEYAHMFGESLEQVSRFAAFLTSREMGKTIEESVNDAKEITVNFNRKGSGKRITFEEAKYLTDKNGQPLNIIEQAFAVGLSSISPLGRRFIMFFNASIQGLNSMYKLYKKSPRKMVGWTLAFAAIGAINALLHSMFDDDDDYLDMPEYERRNALMLGGNGVYLKWALPQEARAYYALGDLAVETLLGRSPHESFLGEAAKIGSELLPINPTEGKRAFLPSAAIPVVELWINEDYKGDPIYNDQKWLTDEEKKRTAKWSKAYQGTGKPYVSLSKVLNSMSGGDEYNAGWINIQPEKVQHLVQSAFGGTIRTADKFINSVIAGFDPEEEVTVRQFPFLNRFLTINDERYRNVHVNDVYDYYSAEAEHTIRLEKQYTKDRNADALKDLKSSDEYKWARIYSKYKKPIKKYQEKIKAAEGTAERMELMKQQDELKRKMIKEISDL